MSTASQKKTIKKAPVTTRSKKTAAVKPANGTKAKTAPAKKPVAAKRTSTPKKKAASAPKQAQVKVAPDVNQPKTKEGTQAAIPDPGLILGQVAFLMSSSPLHKHMFIGDLEWLVLPPIKLNQFRVFRKDGNPVAFASWALLSEEVEQDMQNGRRKLKPHEWNEGDRPWLIDLVNPFGGGEEILAHLRDHVFKETGLKTIVPGSVPGETEVVTLRSAQG